MFIRKLGRLQNSTCASCGKILLAFLLIFGFSHTACSHFEKFLARILILTEENDGLRVYGRLPLALVLLPKTWAGVDAGQKLDYIQTERVGNAWRYYVDAQAIQQNSHLLANAIINQYEIVSNEHKVEQWSDEELKIYSFHHRPPFSSIDKAMVSFADIDKNDSLGHQIFGSPTRLTEDTSYSLEVFDAVVDISFFIPNTSLESSLPITSKLGSHLSIIDKLANIIVIDAEDKTIQTTYGVLDVIVVGKNSVLNSLINQVISGIEHILIGLDHILCIVLLVLSSSYWLDTIKKATLFTLGHSITLAIGVWGNIAFAEWFIAVIEIFIALSIAYAGIMIIRKRPDTLSFYKIFFIGLIHGFGFSFALHSIIEASGTISLVSFLAFNVGIEIGQLLILLVAGLLIYIMTQYIAKQRDLIQYSVSLPCIAISLFWIYQRSVNLVG